MACQDGNIVDWTLDKYLNCIHEFYGFLEGGISLYSACCEFMACKRQTGRVAFVTTDLIGGSDVRMWMYPADHDRVCGASARRQIHSISIFGITKGWRKLKNGSA